LVTAGYYENSDKTEVIDVVNSDNNCRPLANIPFDEIEGVTGGLIGNKPVICGGAIDYQKGDYRKDCFVIGQSVTNQPKMSSARAFATGVTLNKHTLWITGGRMSGDTNKKNYRSTEFIQLNGTRPGPDLPNFLQNHCLVALNSTTILLTGGRKNWSRSTMDVYYYHIDQHSWTKGPPMNTNRHGHSCAMFKSALHDNADVVAVVGGYDDHDSLLATSEFLIVGTDFWTQGRYRQEYRTLAHVTYKFVV
jgi:hypothetical protein